MSPGARRLETSERRSYGLGRQWRGAGRAAPLPLVSEPMAPGPNAALSLESPCQASRSTMTVQADDVEESIRIEWFVEDVGDP